MSFQAICSGCAEYFRTLEGVYDLAELCGRALPLAPANETIQNLSGTFDAFCSFTDGVDVLPFTFELLSGKVIQEIKSNSDGRNRLVKTALVINGFFLSAVSTAALFGAKTAGFSKLPISPTIRFLFIGVLALGIADQKAKYVQGGEDRASKMSQWDAKMSVICKISQISYQVYKLLGGFKNVKVNAIVSASLSLVVIATKIANTETVKDALFPANEGK